MEATDVHDLSPLDERNLVERARSDPDAFAALYRRYLPRIHGFAYRRCGSREAAEDITSATFERALRGLDGFRWKGGGFAPWLFRIAANEAADSARRRSRLRDDRAQAGHAVLEYRSGDADIERVEAGDQIDGLLAALDNLSPRYQRAISLRYLADLDHESAAQAMGVTKPVMAVTLNRAMAALRKAAAGPSAGPPKEAVT